MIIEKLNSSCPQRVVTKDYEWSLWLMSKRWTDNIFMKTHLDWFLNVMNK